MKRKSSCIRLCQSVVVSVMRLCCMGLALFREKQTSLSVELDLGKQ